MSYQDPIPHGTAGGYTNHGCRCDRCREACRVMDARRRAERYAHTTTHGLTAGVNHGLSAYRNWGCRCPVCTAANKESCRSFRHKASTR